jgi:CRISPR/Cas system Type II protein with McrA/HNH and RuvC-like nuclease domain
MPKPTPEYVRNMIRRSLRELVDPSPSRTEISDIWTYFKSECAYCGKKLNRKKREGQIDHLISASARGTNHISNRVLSCSQCNEKEKQHKPWKTFLSQKESDRHLRKEREMRIREWQKRNHRKTKLHRNVIKRIDELGDNICKFYDQGIKKVKNL